VQGNRWYHENCGFATIFASVSAVGTFDDTSTGVAVPACQHINVSSVGPLCSSVSVCIDASLIGLFVCMQSRDSHDMGGAQVSCM
jgi:hypothetical protein